ncbi:hypothetical protein DWF00_01730 [Bosea caraganae]|uniref:hypothetical protein n=1 Tax=Bosea caraganae TaxID=2763117 RepID=UPI000E0C3BEF|nr:hypothetical protein [Bosea caraganae]RDJ30808.1 hypothetical protein DWF00_01730 [Bosea caraganae]
MSEADDPQMLAHIEANVRLPSFKEYDGSPVDRAVQLKRALDTLRLKRTLHHRPTVAIGFAAKALA